MASLDISNIPREDIKPLSADEVNRLVALFKDPVSKAAKPSPQEAENDLLEEFFLAPLMRFGKNLQAENVSKSASDDPNQVFDTCHFFEALDSAQEVQKNTEIEERDVDHRNDCLQSVFDPVLDFKVRR